MFIIQLVQFIIPNTRGEEKERERAHSVRLHICACKIMSTTMIKWILIRRNGIVESLGCQSFTNVYFYR